MTPEEIRQKRALHVAQYREAEGDLKEQREALNELMKLKKLCPHPDLVRSTPSAVAVTCPDCGYGRFADTPP